MATNRRDRAARTTQDEGQREEQAPDPPQVVLAPPPEPLPLLPPPPPRRPRRLAPPVRVGPDRNDPLPDLMPLRRSERLERLLTARLAQIYGPGARGAHTREVQGLLVLEEEARRRREGLAINPRPRLSSRVPLAPDGTYMFPGDELVPLVGETPLEYVNRMRGYRRRDVVIGGFVRGQGEHGWERYQAD